jgi:hypothetical protein
MTTLLDEIKIPVSMVHYEAIKKIDECDFSLFRKKATQETGINDQSYLDKAELYLKRYYVLHILDPLNTIALSKKVDFLWHFHIEYTERYMAFCDEIFGTFIHHQPLLKSDEKAVEYVKDIYEYTYALNEKVFHTIDDDILPKDTDKGLCCNSGNGTTGFRKQIIEAALFPKRVEQLKLILSS